MGGESEGDEVRRKKDSIIAEPIKYEDGCEWRILDFRPVGCDCIPLLAMPAAGNGTDRVQR